MGEGKGDEVSFIEEFVPRGNIGFKHSKLFVEEEETFRQLRCVIVLKRIIELQSRLIEEYRTIVSNRVVIELVSSLLFKSQTNKSSYLLFHPPPSPRPPWRQKASVLRYHLAYESQLELQASWLRLKLKLKKTLNSTEWHGLFNEALK